MTLLRVAATLLAIAVISSVCHADGALEHDFVTANQLYQDGDYSEAVESYLNLVAAGVENPAVYYNLGNAYFKTNQLGMAVAMYNRALKLDPRNEDIRANLEFARRFTVDRIDPGAENPIWRWYKSLVMTYTTNEWTMLSSILYVIVILILMYMIWTRDRRLLTKGIMWTAAVVMVICLTCTAVNVQFCCYSPRGTIVVPEVSVKAGPGDDFGEQFLAHEGLTFEILRQESGWYLGVFDNRLKGWIKVSDTVKI